MTNSARTPESFTTVLESFIVWPRPEIRQRWRAELLLGDATTFRCRHEHRTEATAAKCGARSVRLGNTWE